MMEWQTISDAPKTHILLNLGETIPGVPDIRVGQWIDEAALAELGEIGSAAGGWIIWNSDSDWFVAAFEDALGWLPLPKPILLGRIRPPNDEELQWARLRWAVIERALDRPKPAS